MTFVHKQLAPSGGFGHDLKDLRELRGLSYEEVATITKIHPSIIKILEEERLEELADPAYSERHVRSIVAALEGRPGYFVKKYRELVDERIVKTEKPSLLRRRPRRSDFFVLSRALALLGFLAFVAITAGYLIWQGVLLQEPPELSVLEPLDGAVITSPQVSVNGQTDPTAIVTVNGRTAVVKQDGQFSVSFDLPRGATTLTIEARRRYGSVVREVRRVTYERPELPPEEIEESIIPTSTSATSTSLTE
jgi:transcriptional regulator with XRE-family HTH domain